MSYTTDTNYMRYLNKSINLEDSSLDGSKYVYVPPNQRQVNHQSLKISSVLPQQQWHNRSRSFDMDLSKKQNTFGLQKTQESNAHLGKNQGFVSPKFKLGSEERKQNTDNILLRDDNTSIDSQESQVTSLLDRLQQKQEQLEDCQRQIRQLVITHEQQLAAVRAERHHHLESQIEGYCNELRDTRAELDSVRRKHQASLKKKGTTPKSHVDLVIQELRAKNRPELHWTSPLNDSTNNVSIIDKQMDTSVLEKTFKCLADELQLDKFSILNTDVLEGVKTLKNINREQQKFIRCLKELVTSCAPKGFFNDDEPSLKDMWKFVKHVLSGYLDSKKTLHKHQDTIDTLCKYWHCTSTEVASRATSLLVELEVLRRVKDGVREMLGLGHVSNLREIERQFDLYLGKR